MLEPSALYPRYPTVGVAGGAERIVWPKPPKARPGRYSESRRHQRNDPPSISPDSEEFFARSRSSSTDTFPTCSNQRARTRAQVHPSLRSGFFAPFLGQSSYRHALSIGTQTAGTLLQRTTVGVW